MNRVHVLAEGQPEETFVTDVLAPYFAAKNVFLTPTIAKTSLSGRANCAPIAAGSPKPIEPRPPEFNQRRGSLKAMNCAAHI